MLSTRAVSRLTTGERGVELDEAGWSALLRDTARIDRALRKAKDTAIDPSLEPQLMRGAELAYADYVYAAFLLFGLRLSSLYYFYFLLLGMACALFVVEFRNSPFSLFLLTTYLGGIFFLQNYAQSYGEQLATLTNSRLFEALSLLPAMHVFLVVWRRTRFGLPTLLTTSAQSALLAFIIDCRVSGRWQIALIVAVAIGCVIADLWRQQPFSWRGGSANGVWAGCIAVAFLAAHMSLISFNADKSYQGEPKYHPVWPSVLGGLLGSSTELQREYLGRAEHADSEPVPDQWIEDAINNDLNKRNDRSSPHATVQNGKIFVGVDNGVRGADPNYGWNEYERLARSLVLRIVAQHPVSVVAELFAKARSQVRLYAEHLSFSNLAGMMMIAVVGGLVWLTEALPVVTVRELISGIGAAITVLSFAAVPPIIEPSPLSVGTLLSYLIAGATAPFALAVLIAKLRTLVFCPVWLKAKHGIS